MSQSVNCPGCEGENTSEASFCRHCGHAMPEEVENLCHACGGDRTEIDRFCRHCGAGTAEAAQEAEPDEDKALEETPQEVPAPKSREPRRDAARKSSSPRKRDGGRPSRASRKEPENNRNLLIFGGILAVAIFAVFFAMQDNDKENKGTPIAPPSNGGGSGVNPAAGQPALIGADPADIVGTITLSPEMLKVAPSARAIYIIARPASDPEGMPIAAAKLPAILKPQQYSIGPANVMMEGNSFDVPVVLTARWDQDGDPLSKPDNDIIGGPKTNPVKPGTRGVDIVLDRPLGARVPAGLAPAKDAPSKPVDNAPAAAGQTISGTIEAAPELADVLRPTGAFFVIARPAGVVGGPPIAVNRIPAASLPITFTLGPQHVMAGGNFDQPLTVTVKWDQDGSAGSQPGDLAGEPAGNPLKPGTTNVKVVLSKKL